MCIAARRGVDRSIGAVSVSRLLAMLYPAEGNLVTGNLKIAQHLIKGRAGRGLIRVRVSVERHRFPPLQQSACIASFPLRLLRRLSLGSVPYCKEVRLALMTRRAIARPCRGRWRL